jgi:hypothetical protein
MSLITLTILLTLYLCDHYDPNHSGQEEQKAEAKVEAKEEEEIDPLDAFMAGLKQPKKSTHKVNIHTRTHTCSDTADILTL